MGVGISLFLFLRKARLLHTGELAVDANDNLVELDPAKDFEQDTCEAIRILHIEGHLFFGVVGELQDTLDEVVTDNEVKVVILRMKRARGMDVTVGATIANAATRLARQGRHLLLAGVRDDVLEVFEETDLADKFEEGAIFPSRARWFASIERAVRHAAELLPPEHDDEHCPIQRYLRHIDEEHTEGFVSFGESSEAEPLPP
jgi:SulP family sulfate permease